MDPRLKELIERFADAVDESDIQYAIGGGVALGVHGYRRYTADLDVFTRDEDRLELMRLLRAAGFATKTVMAPSHYAARLPEHVDPEVRIDILVPADDPELGAVEQPEYMDLAGRQLAVFPIELLIASKFYSDRYEDQRDIAKALELDLFEPETVRILMAAVDPKGARDFEALILSIREHKPRRNRPSRRWG